MSTERSFYALMRKLRGDENLPELSLLRRIWRRSPDGGLTPAQIQFIEEVFRLPSYREHLKAVIKGLKPESRDFQAVLNRKRNRIILRLPTRTLYNLRSILLDMTFRERIRKWACRLCLDNLRVLEENTIRLDPAIKQEIFGTYSGDIPARTLPTDLPHTLRRYQERGVFFIAARRRILLADEMGLGKTIQAIIYTRACPKALPALVVSPASLKMNWKEEFEKWSPGVRVRVLSGFRPDMKLWKRKMDVAVINYEIVRRWYPALRDAGFKYLVLDEAHYCKSPKAQRTVYVRLLAKIIPRMTAMTGTPIENRPIELYPLLNMIAPRLFSNYKEYGKRYCDAFFDGYKMDMTGCSNMEELHELLTSTIMLRRKKEDVLNDLPKKTRTVIHLEPTNRKEYRSAKRDVDHWLEMNEPEKLTGEGKAVGFSKVRVLQSICWRGKREMVIERIREMAEGGTPLVVFSLHRAVVYDLHEQFPSISRLFTGAQSKEERQQTKRDFQALLPTHQILLATYKAAGVGHTFTASSNVILVEMPWNPSLVDQAEDRLHRIGQKDAVTSWSLLCPDTVETDMWELLNQKRDVRDRIVDGKGAGEMSGDILTMLLKKWRDQR